MSVICYQVQQWYTLFEFQGGPYLAILIKTDGNKSLFLFHFNCISTNFKDINELSYLHHITVCHHTFWVFYSVIYATEGEVPKFYVVINILKNMYDLLRNAFSNVKKAAAQNVWEVFE